ncbi:hypothetical protein F5144DRAFT_575902 [Chaetomium tenue]|uniref:Uncharacterized protein n=1 Tax=Chaetomium tenue TaxID=1854479 RepID=A0ACB7P123_9PEZI|nr:hypothetical protein F5144DRAFT_575902 [Chaetomium globosum]
MTTTAAFPSFPALPFELRDQIWHNALPETPSLTLFFFRGKGCWVPRPLVKGDPGYIAGRDQLGFDFLTDRLGHDHPFDLPLCFVNHEARRVALGWLKEQGIKIQLPTDDRPLFVRPFNPELDALYVTRDKWEEFCREPTDRMFEPDLLDQNVDLDSELVKIAISEAFFFESEAISWIPELEMWYDGFRVLLVVIGPQPDFGSIPGPWRWELEGTEGPSFFWNKDNEAFDFHGGNEDVSDKALYEKIGETAKSRLREPLIQRRLDHFQIQPVFAVRRAV